MASRVTGHPPQSVGQRYSQYELHSLFWIASAYVEGSKKEECRTFCRDENEAYYNELTDDVMETYAKDYHGDPRNPINGELYGLFFTANDAYRKTGKPPPKSIFGNKRLSVSASQMVTWAPNLYFSDFYCVNKKREPHYVQLVMTTPGTKQDVFCNKYLIKLDLKDNAFFSVEGNLECSITEDVNCKSDGGDHLNTNKHLVCSLNNSSDHAITCHVTTGVWIEMFFTNDIKLAGSRQELTDVQMVGQRSGGKTGLEKNHWCPKCNIQTQREREPYTTPNIQPLALHILCQFIVSIVESNVESTNCFGQTTSTTQGYAPNCNSWPVYDNNNNIDLNTAERPKRELSTRKRRRRRTHRKRTEYRQGDRGRWRTHQQRQRPFFRNNTSHRSWSEFDERSRTEQDPIWNHRSDDVNMSFV